MSNKSLSNLASEATEETNVTGVMTPILEVDPEQGTLIRLLNRVNTGSAPGLPLFLDLRDSGDNPLPVDTDLLLRVDRPTDDEPSAVSVREDNIAAWDNLSLSEQRNEENIDATKIQLQGDRVNVRDKDTLQVAIEGSAQIDWSNSELYFAREGVQETAFDG